MTQQQSRILGFGVEVIILAVAIVSVVATAGWVVYDRHHKTTVKSEATTSSSTSSQSQASTNTNPTPQPALQYLVIPEWGVKLALDSTTASLYYYINPQQPNIAYFSLKTISDIAPNCTADKGWLGAIGRQTDEQHQAAAANQSALNQPGTINIGSYWYLISTSHATCVGTTAQQSSITQALPSYNPGELLKTLNTLTAD
jgi:hypothetical protein